MVIPYLEWRANSVRKPRYGRQRVLLGRQPLERGRARPRLGDLGEQPDARAREVRGVRGVERAARARALALVLPPRSARARQAQAGQGHATAAPAAKGGSSGRRGGWPRSRELCSIGIWKASDKRAHAWVDEVMFRHACRATRAFCTPRAKVLGGARARRVGCADGSGSFFEAILTYCSVFQGVAHSSGPTGSTKTLVFVDPPPR